MTYPVKLEELLCFSIYRAGHAFNHLYRPLLDAIGLTYPQYLVMVCLWERDDRSVKELGKAISLESNTTTPILKRLKALGLIARVRDPDDERSVRIRLTPEGRALARQADHIPACIAESVELPVRDVEKLLQMLRAIEDRIETRGEVTS